jgi:hypothetical protein
MNYGERAEAVEPVGTDFAVEQEAESSDALRLRPIQPIFD